MKKIIAITAVVLAALLSLSCSKEEANNQAAELIGSWKGYSASMYIGGEPVDEVEYILTFTADKITINRDGKSETHSYTTGTNSEGTKYFTVIKSDGKYSVFYSISGTTMTYLGGDSSDTYFWPKTFEKALL